MGETTKETQVRVGDFLIALAHYLPKGRKCFNRDSEKLNRFFYNQKPDYPEALTSFHFKMNGHWPECRDLEQAISNLHGSGLIVTASTMPNDYHFDPECETAYQEYVSARIPIERLKDIHKIAEEFDREIGINETLHLDR